MRNFFILCAITVLFAVASFGQSLNQIASKCPAPNPLSRGNVFVKGDGNIYYNPCPSGSSIFTGIVNFSGATIVGGGFVTGTGTANTLPKFTGASSIGNSSFTDNGTNISIGTSGSKTITLTNYATPASVGAFTVSLAGTLSTSGVTFSGNGNFAFDDSSNAGNFNLIQINTFSLQRTITAAGTTGAQVINKPNGSVNFAAAATTLVVTNSTVLTTSTINALAQRADATCFVTSVTPAAGSFTITMSAACTAETRVAFWVNN